MRAEDGRPVAGAEVNASTRVCITDSDGRYMLGRVPPDGEVIVEVDGFVPMRVPGPLRVADGARMSLADARLDRGGSIMGTVQPQGDVHKATVKWAGCVLPEGPGADRVIAHMCQRGPLGQDLSFRVGPLPAGTYALDAQIGSYELDGATGVRRRWAGRTEGVRVRVGQEMRDVRIAVAPVASP